ncbi:MAG: hypothetical protein A2X58_06820 [Nitrospirae bacterium GWC2_56_14]|nr:MAG: hypothetical protein A2X58_06820 [Nitrospirae bacterium GWC2_56_14]
MADEINFQEISTVLRNNQQEILQLWITRIVGESRQLVEMAGEENLKRQASGLLDRFIHALANGTDVEGTAFEQVRTSLLSLSDDWAMKEITPTDIVLFIFSMKDSYLSTLQGQYRDPAQLNEIIFAVNRMMDRLGLITLNSFMKRRESIIKEQQRALMELSVPIVKVWDRILMIPLIGILDSSRTQLVMETLLTAIEETQSKVAILDISGIPIVDTLVAKHLLRTVAATKLMGAVCIITGIRSKISQTMIQLGIDLSSVTTRTTMADGLKVAFQLTGIKPFEVPVQ